MLGNLMIQKELSFGYYINLCFKNIDIHQPNALVIGIDETSIVRFQIENDVIVNKIKKQKAKNYKKNLKKLNPASASN